MTLMCPVQGHQPVSLHACEDALHRRTACDLIYWIKFCAPGGTPL